MAYDNRPCINVSVERLVDARFFCIGTECGILGFLAGIGDFGCWTYGATKSDFEIKWYLTLKLVSVFNWHI